MMIRINLLPQDYRRKESTPIAVLLPMLLCIVLTVGAGCGWGWLHFAELERVKSQANDLEQTLQSKTRQVTYAQALRSEQDDFETRKQTIQEIASSRVLWAKKLDQFLNVATSDDDGQQYLIWLQHLEVKQPAQANAKGKAAVGETMSIKGRCFAEKNPLQHYNNFHAAVRNSEFFSDFVSLDDPAGKSLEFDDGLKQSSAWDVSLTMNMKPHEPPKGPKKSVVRVAEADKPK